MADLDETPLLSSSSHQGDALPTLLAVSTTAPWPVADGYTVRVFNLLEQLSRSWAIKLLAPPLPPGSDDFPAGVAEYLPMDLLDSEGQGFAYPWRFDQAQLDTAIRDAVRVHRPARALVWRGAEAVWFDGADLPPAVADLIDCTPLDLWRGFVAQRSPRIRYRKLRELGVSALFARRTVQSFSAVVCAGEADVRWLRRLGGRRSVHLVSNGVNQPDSGCEAGEAADALAPPRLSFVGTLNFEPNTDAVGFLSTEIWPLVRAALPDAELIIAGRNPTPEILELDRRSGIEVHADVPDIYAVLRRSQVSIAPMRSGVGVKNKVLEAWACARPVVLTPLAVNGLVIPDGHEALVRSTPAGLAHAAIALLRDRALATRLGAQACNHVHEHYTWKNSAAQIDRLLREAAPDRLSQSRPQDRPAAAESGLPRAQRRPASPRPGAYFGQARKGSPLQVDREPTLYVVVDTEAEFDWSREFASNLTSVSAIVGVSRGQEVLDRFGIRPIYVVDYPVASQPAGYRPILEILERGACHVGAHLHPWTTPPFEEVPSEWNSFAGNLPPSLEERKLQTLIAAITASFGRPPRFFKAGRYGIGANTMALLARSGISVDFSIMPGTNMRARGGPDFRAYSADPYLFDDVLSVPMTRGYVGLLASTPPTLKAILERRLAQRLKLPAILSKAGLINRVTLTPEGVTADEQKTLIRRLLARGHRTFVLHYHSPSLMPGHTAYARTEAEVQALLECMDEVCRFFVEDLGGKAGDPASLLQLAGRHQRPVPVEAALP